MYALSVIETSQFILDRNGDWQYPWCIYSSGPLGQTGNILLNLLNIIASLIPIDT